jgi:hypothetical protein
MRVAGGAAELAEFVAAECVAGACGVVWGVEGGGNIKRFTVFSQQQRVIDSKSHCCNWQ